MQSLKLNARYGNNSLSTNQFACVCCMICESYRNVYKVMHARFLRLICEKRIICTESYKWYSLCMAYQICWRTWHKGHTITLLQFLVTWFETLALYRLLFTKINANIDLHLSNKHIAHLFAQCNIKFVTFSNRTKLYKTYDEIGWWKHLVRSMQSIF